ncbi:hypothetical protein [Roseateles sp. P5_E7]
MKWKRGFGSVFLFGGCFCDEPFDSLHRAGSPPRRAGNFLLRRQKKVTKEEALNPHSSGLSRLAVDRAQTRPAALSLLSL